MPMRAAALLLIPLLLAIPVHAQSEDDWDERSRSGWTVCDPPEPDPQRVTRQTCLEGPADVAAAGEGLFFRARGSEEGTPLRFRVLGPGGAPLHESEHVSHGWMYADPDIITWPVPLDVAPGSYTVELQAGERRLAHALRIEQGPRIYVENAVGRDRPARSDPVWLVAGGIEAGPVELRITQGRAEWSGSYRVEPFGDLRHMTVTPVEIGMAGVRSPELLVFVSSQYGGLDIRPSIVAPDGELVRVRLVATKDGERVEDELVFLPRPGGPTLLVDVRPPRDWNPTATPPTASPSCQTAFSALVHVFALDREGPIDVILSKGGREVASASANGGPVVEVPFPLDDVPGGQYTATVGNESRTFDLGYDGCPRSTPPPLPPMRKRGIPLEAGALALAMVAASAFVRRRRS